jgi:hypothetical protein
MEQEKKGFKKHAHKSVDVVLLCIDMVRAVYS